MNETTTRDQLDHFESALLTELKGQVALNAVALPAPRRPRRRVLGLSLGGVVAVAGTALGVSALLPTPAFSVSESNGDLRVEVNRLEGAEKLERELARHGVTADITFLPPGMRCAENRYVEAPSRGGTSLEVGGETFVVSLDAGTVGSDQTFVLWASVQQYENGNRASVWSGVAEGPVAPCAASSDPVWDEPIDADMGAPVPD